MTHFNLTLRSRPNDPTNSPGTVETPLQIEAARIAAIVCDMWDHHWCRGAESRVNELVPAMNRLLCSIRDSGAFIVHAPSETMAFYEGSLGRLLAQSAAHHDAPCDLSSWQRLDPNVEGELPIDDQEVSCDDLPTCPIPEVWPWTRQHAGIEIGSGDAITDKGQEVHNLLEENRTEFVLMMGVHTNMCVLGRPFGIRRLVEAGRKVALVRDMTDTMYCSRKRPFVNHFHGTELVIEHIERYWCPTITSDQIVGGEPFRFQ